MCATAAGDCAAAHGDDLWCRGTDRARWPWKIGAGRYAGAAGSLCADYRTRESRDNVLAHFAGEHFHFMAPDAILAQPAMPERNWLIVDEAAAIAAPILTQLAARFPRVLLTTTVQGYEGTGRGFILKFCARLERVRYFTLDEPLRWSRQDPLEQWLNQALLFEDATPAPVSLPAAPRLLPADAWQQDPSQPEAAYRLWRARTIVPRRSI